MSLQNITGSGVATVPFNTAVYIYVSCCMEVIQHARVAADPFPVGGNLGYTTWHLMGKHSSALALRCFSPALHPCLMRPTQTSKKMLE